LQDWAAVEQSPGVGKKLAQRIVAELRGQGAGAVGRGAQRAGRDGQRCRDDPRGNAAAEAISALTNLGYQPGQASHAIAAAMKELGDAAATPALIRRGLKELARYDPLPVAMRWSQMPLTRGRLRSQSGPMQIYLPVAELSLNIFLLIGLGLAIGFLSGMFGIGGGFIMTPFLIFLACRRAWRWVPGAARWWLPPSPAPSATGSAATSISRWATC
jgi:hypothetical protein